jgi:hypothetical protein
MDRLIHGAVLGSRLIQRVSFDIETRKSSPLAADAHAGSVFVCGLARSGTTALLRLLYATGEFESLTYRDMPFVMMPVAWAKMTGSLQRHLEPVERAHGDSVMVDLDSPEGFESVFWRTMSNSEYDDGTALKLHEPSDRVMSEFRTYVGVIANRSANGRKRYLSKNNNNLIRLAAIQRALPDAGILVMYRDPLQTAASTMRQHKRFCELQRADNFVLRYMNWLEHHEFGLGHKPFRVGGAAAPEPENPDYWLTYWIDVYEYLLGLHVPFHLICYETLCANPVDGLTSLFGILRMRSTSDAFAPMLRASVTKDLPDFNPALANRAQETFRKLLADGRNACRN